MHCPICRSTGVQVEPETVRNLVASNVAPTITNGDYYLCPHPACPVAYFGEHFVLHQQLRTPIWFKYGADPKIICYCHQVTEQQIVTAVKQGGARTVAEVARLTGAMSHSNCQINNPTGRCCSSVIKQLIEETVEKLCT